MVSDDQNAIQGDNAAPRTATTAVLKPSEPVGDNMVEVSGIDFDKHMGKELTASELIAGMAHMGFQASAVAEAVRIIDGMVGIGIYIYLHLMLTFVDSERGEIPRRGTRLPSSLATLRTSSPPVSGKSSAGSYSTSTSRLSSPQLAVWRRTSSNAWHPHTWARFTWEERSYGHRV